MYFPSYALRLTVLSSVLYSFSLDFKLPILPYENDFQHSESEAAMLNALWIVILGMVIIFAVLGILLLVLIALGKIFKPKKDNQEG